MDLPNGGFFGRQKRSMRRIVISILSLALVLFAGCGKESGEKSSAHQSPKDASVQTLAPETLLRIHFDGTEKLFAGTNASFLKEIWSLPETREFQNQILEKLSRAPFQLYQQHISGTNDFASTIRPLLDDVLRSEVFVESRGTNETPQFVLCIKLNDDRAGVWSRSLRAVVDAWTGSGAYNLGGNKFGWELKKHHPPNTIRFSRAGEWVVLGIGQDDLPFQKKLLAAIKKNGRPVAANPSSWLEIAGDFSRLKSWLNLPEPLARSQFQLSVSSKGEDSKTRLTLTTADKFDMQLEPWRVPTNTIREPLMSFTALRGARPFLEQFHAVRDYDLHPVPNQIYFWALEQIPMQTYVMAVCDDATNMLKRIAPKLMSSLSSNLFHRQIGKIVWAADESGLVWQGIVPIVAPFLQAVKEPSGDFLFAGLFPRSPHKRTLPDELLSELNARTNLVYYDWEITGNRIIQWQNLSQLPDLVRGRNLFMISEVGQKFLAALTQRCGNTITEISLTKPNELVLERKSNAGFTAVELVFLVHWLDATNFPTFGQQVPPHSDAVMNSAQKTP